MKLSAPVHKLKSNAQKLKKEKGIPLNEALDLIAKQEGFTSWSLLQSKSESLPKNINEILEYFNSGDMVIVGGRPGHFKTQLCIELLVKAIEKNKYAYFFSLELVHKDLARRIAFFDPTIGEDKQRFHLSYSDDICADFIIEQCKERKDSIIFIDYLQLLDQKRTNLEIDQQLEKLKKFASDNRSVIIFISQIKREVEYRIDSRPTLEDIRMPNHFDLKLFNKIIFLYKKSSDAIDIDFHKPRVFRLESRFHSIYIK